MASDPGWARGSGTLRPRVGLVLLSPVSPLLGDPSSGCDSESQFWKRGPQPPTNTASPSFQEQLSLCLNDTEWLLLSGTEP